MASSSTAGAAPRRRGGPAGAEDDAAPRWPVRGCRGCRRRPRPSSTVMAGSSSQAAASARITAIPVGVASSPGAACAHPPAAGQLATAGTGTGSSPCAVRTRPEPTATSPALSGGDAEVLQRGADPDDVGDRVQRAHLVEVHVVRGDAVHVGLGVGEPGEDGGAPGRGSAPAARRRPAGRGWWTRCAGAGRRPAARRRTLDGAQPGPGHRGRGDPDGARHHRVHGELDRRQVGAGVDQGAEQHVAGDAGGRVDPGMPVCRHASPAGAGAAIWAARCPAPYPLSMLTTATPGAQAFSMASSAARPPKAAP